MNHSLDSSRWVARKPFHHCKVGISNIIPKKKIPTAPGVAWRGLRRRRFVPRWFGASTPCCCGDSRCMYVIRVPRWFGAPTPRCCGSRRTYGISGSRQCMGSCSRLRLCRSRSVDAHRTFADVVFPFSVVVIRRHHASEQLRRRCVTSGACKQSTHERI